MEKCYDNKFENLDGINNFLEKHTKLSQEEMESLIRHIKNKNVLFLSPKPKHQTPSLLDFTGELC